MGRLGRSILAIVCGYLLIGALLSPSLAPPKVDEATGKPIMWGGDWSGEGGIPYVGIGGTFVGGFVAGWIAGRKEVQHGVLLAIVFFVGYGVFAYGRLSVVGYISALLLGPIDIVLAAHYRAHLRLRKELRGQSTPF